MLNTTNVSWGRIVGTATGSVLAGPVGALVGNLAGGLLQTFLPGAAGVSTLLGAIVGKTLEKGSEAVIKQWSPAEKQQINHDLQTAFRDALIEAINDIGGGSCFRSAWQVGRDVPPQAVFPLATLERQDAALAEQACQLLQKMVSAVLAQQVLPLEPPVDQPAASVVACGQCYRTPYRGRLSAGGNAGGARQGFFRASHHALLAARRGTACPRRNAAARLRSGGSPAPKAAGSHSGSPGRILEAARPCLARL